MYNIFRMNTPTKITVSRIIATIIMGIAFFVVFALNKYDYLHIPMVGHTHINWLYLSMCIFFVIAAFTDMLDGYLARSRNQVTDLGKFLDPVADKLLVNSMLIILCVTYQGFMKPEQYVIPVYCVVLMIARDTVVDCLRFVAAKKNVVIAANIFGKAKTVAQMITIPLVLLNGFPFSYFDMNWGLKGEYRIVAIFVYITTILSLLSGIIYVIQNRHVFKESSRKKIKR